jgi:hypothetical protein
LTYLVRLRARTSGFATALAQEEMHRETLRRGAARGARRRHADAFDELPADRRGPPTTAQERHERGARLVGREPEDARTHPVTQSRVLSAVRIFLRDLAPERRRLQLKFGAVRRVFLREELGLSILD